MGVKEDESESGESVVDSPQRVPCLRLMFRLIHKDDRDFREELLWV